jgi:iron complex outermembrane receptor protein
MEFKRNKVATALACVMGASAAVTLTNAFAQAVNPDVPSLTRQPADIRVDVTGSNIKRIEGEGSLPVQVITREEIDKSGATTAMELLQQISANNSLGAVSIASSVGATTLSAQTASLRGLGGGRTLVLINGHRLEGFSGEIQGVQGVNLAAIPFAALDRVEILKDGASAVYGSDAIGGVINFITRNDYNGAEVTGFYGTPTRGGGGDQWTGTASVGFGDLNKNGWNAFLSGSYNEQKSLDQADRNFSNSSYRPDIGLIGVSSNTNPGRVTTGGIGTIFNGQRANDTGNCGPNLLFVNDDILGTNCFFDPSRVHGINMIPHDKLTNFFGNANFKINNDWTAYVQGLYSKDETRLVIQPGPVSNLFVFGPDDTPATITLQPTSAFYPHDIAAAAAISCG